MAVVMHARTTPPAGKSAADVHGRMPAGDPALTVAADREAPSGVAFHRIGGIRRSSHCRTMMVLAPPITAGSRGGLAAVDSDAVQRAPAAALLDFPLDAVDGGEIIIFAIKPSMWAPVFDSCLWLLAAVGLAVSCLVWGWGLSNFSPQVTAQIILALAAARMLMAIIRWVSSWYVLTNRRVVEITGVRAPQVTSAMLVDIRNTYVAAAIYERPLRLGTITFVSQRDTDAPWSWAHVREPDDVHRAIRKAIENAIDAMPPR